MGPCADLIAAADVLGCCDVDQYDPDHPPSDAAVAAAAAVASRVAWTLGGRRHGECEVTGERPSLARCGCSTRVSVFPVVESGTISNVSCGCDRVSEVTLARTPVRAVSEVRIAGVALDPSSYQLLAPNRLVRRDGGRWPTNQNLHRSAGGDDVLVVDYTWGETVDDFGVRAIGTLACELVKACQPDADCRLPSAVRSVVRQGVSIDMLDPFDFLNDGRTGVYEFDQWLATVNPGRASRAPVVRSPDVARAVVG